jgi:UTP-glucose-1-phosphate uridylyltransferase
MKPTLLVMAAGMGSRYGGLKQIDPVGPSGEIILEYSIYDAIRAGFGKVVFIIRRDFEQLFKDAIGNKFTGKIEIDYCFQDMTAEIGDHKIPEGRSKPWGTGHAILMAKNVIKEPFAAINADDFYGRNSYKLIADYLSRPEATAKDYTMCGFKLRNTLSENGAVARGVCQLSASSMLTTVIERTNIEKDGSGSAKFTDADGTVYSLTGNEIVSMNMWGFQPSIFTHLERMFKTFLAEKGNEIKSEFYIPFVVDALVKEGNATVKVLPTPDSWFGVTYPGDKPMTIASIQALVTKGEYPASLWK